MLLRSSSAGDASGLTDGRDPSAAAGRSPTRSPPARSSSVRPRSSRSWSRTRSTPAPAGSRSRSSSAARGSIRVEDDGDGMAPEDARLAIERHATSKIAHAGRSRRDPDARLPRRGAAQHRVGLALHAAHARARGDAERAPRSRSTPARSRRSARSARPKARCIEVADLFYNLPARRKFLKSDTAETAQVSRLVTQFALGYPEVGFTLTSGPARRCSQCPPAGTLRDRFFQLYGDRPDLVDVRKEAAGLRSRASSRRSATRDRPGGRRTSSSTAGSCKDRTIAHAIIEAYSVATIKERSPEVHLFLDDCPRPGRRQRASDEGGSPVPRAVARARGPAAGPRGSAGPGPGP